MLIVGLGNPGSEYEKTRHNIGFNIVDLLAIKFGFSWQDSSKFCGKLATGIFEGKKIIFLKPNTYMNNSGRSVALVAHYYKIDLQNLLVIHDELDLECGIIRYKIGGGHAGHNGLRSIDQTIGNLYNRIRVGIGKPIHKEQVSEYVLSNFTKNEKEMIDTTSSIITENINILLGGDIEKFKTNITKKKEL